MKNATTRRFETIERGCHQAPSSYILLSLTAVLSLLLTGCNPYTSGEWESANFELPDKAGSGTLSVRTAHLFLAEYEYQMHVQYGTKNFDVTPSMQTGGPPNIRLTWVERSSTAGPFLVITHVAPKTTPFYELIDFKTSKFYGGEGSDADDLQKAVKRAKKGKEILIGNLDDDCMFHAAPQGIQNEGR